MLFHVVCPFLCQKRELHTSQGIIDGQKKCLEYRLVYQSISDNQVLLTAQPAYLHLP